MREPCDEQGRPGRADRGERERHGEQDRTGQRKPGMAAHGEQAQQPERQDGGERSRTVERAEHPQVLSRRADADVVHGVDPLPVPRGDGQEALRHAVGRDRRHCDEQHATQRALVQRGSLPCSEDQARQTRQVGETREQRRSGAGGQAHRKAEDEAAGGEQQRPADLGRKRVLDQRQAGDGGRGQEGGQGERVAGHWPGHQEEQAPQQRRHQPQHAHRGDAPGAVVLVERHHRDDQHEPAARLDRERQQGGEDDRGQTADEADPEQIGRPSRQAGTPGTGLRPGDPVHEPARSRTRS